MNANVINNIIRMYKVNGIGVSRHWEIASYSVTGARILQGT